jgi:hypothetical protein|tara:strand:+ start:123 stop:449 length:327 start_codon:yes stop_codon:yes gene_type:complete
MGEEPDPARMPLDSSEFPEEVQVAFFMFSLLSDNWDGTSGSYMGKDWSHCSHLFKVYEIEDPRTTMFFMKTYEVLLVNYRAEQAEEKRKQSERKSQQGGKTYTHNVRG